MAIVSLVLGTLGFCSAGVLGVVGVALGIVAIIGINKSEGRLTGSGLAIAGISVGAVSLLTSCLLIGLFLPALGKARENAMALKAKHHMVLLSNLAAEYADEHGRWPPLDDWESALEPYANDRGISLADLIVWPGREDEGRVVAINARLADEPEGLPWRESQSRATVLFFQVRPGSPAAGGPELMPTDDRWRRRGVHVVFTDHHAETILPHEADRLTWDP